MPNLKAWCAALIVTAIVVPVGACSSNNMPQTLTTDEPTTSPTTASAPAKTVPTLNSTTPAASPSLSIVPGLDTFYVTDKDGDRWEENVTISAPQPATADSINAQSCLAGGASDASHSAIVRIDVALTLLTQTPVDDVSVEVAIKPTGLTGAVMYEQNGAFVCASASQQLSSVSLVPNSSATVESYVVLTDAFSVSGQLSPEFNTTTLDVGSGILFQKAQVSLGSGTDYCATAPDPYIGSTVDLGVNGALTGKHATCA